jgi:hypothetical protein
MHTQQQMQEAPEVFEKQLLVSSIPQGAAAGERMKRPARFDYVTKSARSIIKRCDEWHVGAIRCNMLRKNRVGFEGHVRGKHHENVAWKCKHPTKIALNKNHLQQTHQRQAAHRRHPSPQTANCRTLPPF